MRRMAGLGWCLLLAVCGAACGSAAFSLASPTVDATHTCPAGTNNAVYDLHATADADNPTSTSVDIRSVSAAMVVAAVHGAWEEPVGSTYEAGAVSFAPKKIGAGSKAKLTATITSACTNGQHQGVADNYGEYTVKLTVVTSAGTFKLTSRNKHRILAP